MALVYYLLSYVVSLDVWSAVTHELCDKRVQVLSQVWCAWCESVYSALSVVCVGGLGAVVAACGVCVACCCVVQAWVLL